MHLCGCKKICVFELPRCSVSLRLIFGNEAALNDRKNSIHDKIYTAKNERSCADVFCELVGIDDCHRTQFVSSQIDAVNATVGH